ncbi:aromatic-ring hydroxylase C-terminal domain-containing protein [Streptomyces sp. IBSNAI002]|uniref:aromatic-ring hydroxylase C-terminal domain-containing protein n=1 Tax=Streptomyces sp. IBSNAI002 TaxID=3457500 RepID=UPI003FD04475
MLSLLRPDAHLLLDLTAAGTLGVRLPRPGPAVHTAAPTALPAAWSGVRAALIRPDGHVAWAGADQDDDKPAAAANEAVSATCSP